jgi:hypothetical protein
VLRTRSPLIPGPKPCSPLDLHVLSAPPAFVLSQDQTLRRDRWNRPRKAGFAFLLESARGKRHLPIEPSQLIPPDRPDGFSTSLVVARARRIAPVALTGIRHWLHTLFSSQGASGRTAPPGVVESLAEGDAPNSHASSHPRAVNSRVPSAAPPKGAAMPYRPGR